MWKRSINRKSLTFFVQNTASDKLLNGKLRLGKHHRCFINLVQLQLTDWCLTSWHLNYYNFHSLQYIFLYPSSIYHILFFFLQFCLEFKLAAGGDDSQKDFLVHFKENSIFLLSSWFNRLSSAKRMYKHGSWVQSGFRWDTSEQQFSFMLICWEF